METGEGKGKFGEGMWLMKSCSTLYWTMPTHLRKVLKLHGNRQKEREFDWRGVAGEVMLYSTQNNANKTKKKKSVQATWRQEEREGSGWRYHATWYKRQFWQLRKMLKMGGRKGKLDGGKWLARSSSQHMTMPTKLSRVLRLVSFVLLYLFQCFISFEIMLHTIYDNFDTTIKSNQCGSLYITHRLHFISFELNSYSQDCT